MDVLRAISGISLSFLPKMEIRGKNYFGKFCVYIGVTLEGFTIEKMKDEG